MSWGYTPVRKFKEGLGFEHESNRKEKDLDKQYSKNMARFKLRNKLEKEILDEQLKHQLFELEQRRELTKIALQKKKEENRQEEEHKQLLGQKSFREYTDKITKLRNRWESEDEDKLINLEEEDRDEMRKFSGGSGMWE